MMVSDALALIMVSSLKKVDFMENVTNLIAIFLR